MIPLTTCVRDKQKPNEPFSHHQISASALARMKHSATCKIQEKIAHFWEMTLINVFRPECILGRFKESLFFWMEPSSTSSCQGTRRGLLCSGEVCCWRFDSALNGWVTISPRCNGESFWASSLFISPSIWFKDVIHAQQATFPLWCYLLATKTKTQTC